jgi:hypothetical protein
MKKTVHAIAGTLALVIVTTFWIGTLISELLLDIPQVVAVKTAIVWPGLPLMVLAMAATGGSGFALGRGRQGRLLDAKQRRMRILGANGLLVMVPCALFLRAQAIDGQFDTAFYAVQVLELATGALQWTLLAANLRDGLRLSGRLGPRRAVNP